MRVDVWVAISLDVGSIPTVSTNTYVGGFFIIRSFQNIKEVGVLSENETVLALHMTDDRNLTRPYI